MDSLTYLERGGKAKVLPLYVLYGDEPFLKRQVLLALRKRALGDESDDSAVSVHPGDKTNFAAVYDELETAPFFHPRRLVVIEDADPFVTNHRGTLEKRIAHLPATGLLVLDVKTWAANTKLYKLVGDESAIACKAPAAYKLPQWCVSWCKIRHGKELLAQAASLLVDRVGPEMGLLDQELEKLAVFVGSRSKIDSAEVDLLVGLSREQDIWKIFDAIGEGKTGVALTILDRLFDQGQVPLAILGAFSKKLRSLAQAAHLAGQGKTLHAALEQAGVPPFALQGAEQQLRHLGRPRAERLYDWLLEVNVGMKGGSPLPERTLLERFIVRLARKEIPS